MIAMESLSGIATFVAVARASSFTEAGERLGVSKSAVGKAVSRLEDRLGVKLFHRTTRRLSLTADGEAYFAVCAQALDGIAEAEGSLGTRLMEPAGRLRVDMPAAFGRKVMMPILLELGKKYPALQLTITFSDHLIDLVEEGVDVAIRFGALDDSSDLVARKLASHRWVICATPDYLRQHGVPQTPADIAHHRCIVGYRSGRPLAWHVTEDGAAIRHAPPPTYQISDGESMIDAAVAGMGLCQMPLALFRPHIEAGELVTVLDVYTTQQVDVHAVWPRTSHLRPKVRHLVDTLLALAEQGKLD